MLFGPAAAIGCTAMTKKTKKTNMTKPAKVIILRHAEKQNKHELSNLGRRRAKALAKQFLGSKAISSLLLPSEKPAAILAITAHTIETAKPAAKTWGLKTKAARMPGRDKGNEKVSDLDKATKHAARDVLANPAYAGKTVIMVWEHTTSRAETATKHGRACGRCCASTGPTLLPPRNGRGTITTSSGSSPTGRETG